MGRMTSGFIIKSWLRPVEVPSSYQTKPQQQKTIKQKKKESLSSILRGCENHVWAELRHFSDRQEALDVLSSEAPNRKRKHQESRERSDRFDSLLP